MKRDWTLEIFHATMRGFVLLVLIAGGAAGLMVTLAAILYTIGRMSQ